MIKGVFGKYVDINLSNHEVKDYVIPEEWYEKYIGGSGIAARILLKELKPKVDSFSEQNILVFANGPLAGLGIAGSSRVVVMSKSPKTGTLNDSYCGGKFGNVLGKSGYDGIIIRGQAEEPVYISINNGNAEILSAKDLWGLNPVQIEEKICGKNKNVSIACIGRAGENMVIQSCIIVDRNRAIARPGYGAIMGSKRLKAIVIKGNQIKEVADKERLAKLKREYVKKLANSSLQVLSRFGTPSFTENNNLVGNLPTKNFQDGKYLYTDKISSKALMESGLFIKQDSCPNCPIACKRVVKGSFNNKEFGLEWGGPEYEAIAAFGSNCLNDNLEAICLFNKKCNEYGLDTISVGVNISYLMEATEKELLNKEDQIKWGDVEAMDMLIDKIANREGIGDWIARGVKYLTKKVGDESFFVQSKGQECPMHDPRVKYSMAVYYSTSPQGANHMVGAHDPTPAHIELNLPDNPRNSWEERAKIAGVYLNARSFANSLILCAFTSRLVDGDDYFFPIIREILGAVTGKNICAKEMLIIGERNQALLRVFAEKVGYTEVDDVLPQRFYEPQCSTGFYIDKNNLRKTINEYYKFFEYGKYGPTKERLQFLGIDIDSN